MAVLIQPSFAKGEISPELHGRVDTSMYAIGLATARNAIVHTYGGISKRPGLRYLSPVANHSYAPRLIPFEFNTTDQYILEFGDRYMRVIRNDVHVFEPSIPISNVEILSNTRITTNGFHGFSDGDEVLLMNMGGLSKFSGKRYRIGSVTNITFRILDQVTGLPVSTLGNTYTGGGIVQRVYQITTPYVIADIFNLNYVQNADVMTIVHEKYPIYELSRFAHDNWTLERATFVNEVNVPRSISGNVNKTNSRIFDTANDELVVATSGSSKVLNIKISGTYNMTILLQKEEGVVSPSWKTITTYNTPNATVSDTYTTGNLNERVRLFLQTDTSGSATVSLQEDRSVVYKVTATNVETGEESLTGLAPGQAISTISNQTVGRITTTAPHTLIEGDEIYLNSIQGTTGLNRLRFTVFSVISPTVFTLALDGVPVDTSTAGIHVPNTGAVFKTFIRLSGVPVSGMENTVSWLSAFYGALYSIYKEENGIFGLIGTTSSLSFTDGNIEPRIDENPPTTRNPFVTSDDRPRAVGYYQQRRVLGGTNNKPDTSEFSQIGRHGNFSRHDPTQDDDAITATLASDSINEIRHYVPLTSLLVFTSGSEWSIRSGPDSVFGPDTIRQSPHSTWGSSRKKPIRIGNTALFLTPDEANVRSIGYSFEIDGYTGSNLNTLSRHMLAGYTIRDWCYVRNPDSRIYFCRNDGTGLSLAFDQEQEVVAWTTMDTNGKFEACASLRGNPGGVDSAYFVIQRRINGNIVRYIEVMRQTNIDKPKDVFFVDAGYTYDRPVPITNVLTGTGTRVYVADAPSNFVVGDKVDIENIEWATHLDEWGNLIKPTNLTGRFYVNTVSSNSITLQDSHNRVINSEGFPAYISGGVIRRVVGIVNNLDHLEGQSVSVLANGSIISNVVVTDGRIAVNQPSSVFQIGLPYVCDIETLNIEDGRQTIQGILKNVNNVTIRLFKSRGIWVGPDINSLVEFKDRTDEAWGDPTRLISGDLSQGILPSWNSRGRIFIRSHLPLPLTVLAIIPDLQLEDG